MWAVWWNPVVMELCAFWLCESCVVFVGLLVDFRWPANTLLRMGVLGAQDGVVSMVLSGPSLPA